MTTILQLTDLHLLSDPVGELKGVRTRELVEGVMCYLRREQQAGRLHFDHLVITGDLAHDEQRETYVVLREMLGDWVSRCHLIPGNHDSRQYLREIFPALWPEDDGWRTFSFEVGGWRLIGLDSHVPGEVSGHVDEAQLVWLRRQFAEHSDQPAIVFLHHPPFSVESSWLDRIGVANAEEVLAAICSSQQVRAIACGHVHQAFESEFHGVRLLTTPAASLQFKPHTEELQLDDIGPGFRKLSLESSGFSSEVIRVAG